MNLKDALKLSIEKFRKYGITSAHIDAEVILSFIINKRKEFIYAHPEYQLTKNNERKLKKAIQRRCHFEPIAYITNEKEFYGLDFFVDKNVLVPRPETELLIDEVVETAQRNKRIIIADIGTGSGAIAISLAKHLPQAEVMAVDKSIKALRIAKLNAHRHKVNIKLYQGNLLSPIKDRKIEIIAANLPYVDDREKNFHKSESKNIHKKILAHEPHLALYGGKFGLEVYEKMFQQIMTLNYKPRVIICEIGHAYLSQTRKLVKKYFPKSHFEIKKDLRGFNRILIIKT